MKIINYILLLSYPIICIIMASFTNGKLGLQILALFCMMAMFIPYYQVYKIISSKEQKSKEQKK